MHYKFKCCVPGCKSKKPRKVRVPAAGSFLTFHEFPSRSPAREIWIEAVRNQFPDEESQNTWHPQATSRVCSLHFSPDQYKESKKSFLKPGSIPHIFLDQNSSESENLENENDILPLKFSKNINEKWVEEPKLKCDKVPATVNCNKKTHSFPKTAVDCNKTHSIPQIIILPAVSPLLQNANNCNSLYVSDLVVDSSSCSSDTLENSGTTLNFGIAENQNIHIHSVSNLSDKKCSKDQPVKADLSCKKDVCKFSATLAEKETVSEICDTQTTSLEDRAESRFVNTVVHSDELERSHEKQVVTESCGTQTMNLEDKVHSRSVNTAVHSGGSKRKRKNVDYEEFKKYRRTVNRYKARILNLEQKNENLKSLNQGMNASLNLFNIKELEDGIANLNARALFLFEQLNSFAKKETLWSNSTVEFVNTLEKKFPQAYEYLKQTDIISLPPPKNKKTV